MSAVVSQKSISCEAAAKIAQGAIQKAEELGIKINVAVTDSSGVLMAFLRMPGRDGHVGPIPRKRHVGRRVPEAVKPDGR